MKLQNIINQIMGVRFEPEKPIAELTLIKNECRYKLQCLDYDPKSYQYNAPKGKKDCYRCKEVELI